MAYPSIDLLRTLLKRHGKTFDDIKWIGHRNGTKLYTMAMLREIVYRNEAIIYAQTMPVIVGDTWFVLLRSNEGTWHYYWEFVEIPKLNISESE